jgi:hypothetical protein
MAMHQDRGNPDDLQQGSSYRACRAELAKKEAVPAAGIT